MQIKSNDATSSKKRPDVGKVLIIDVREAHEYATSKGACKRFGSLF
jgi:rhodanese-related sulfurtransferase